MQRNFYDIRYLKFILPKYDLLENGNSNSFVSRVVEYRRGGAFPYQSIILPKDGFPLSFMQNRLRYF